LFVILLPRFVIGRKSCPTSSPNQNENQSWLGTLVFPRWAPAPRQSSLLALPCIATLSDWLENLGALYQPIRIVKLTPVVARFTHFPALGTLSTPVILNFVVLHCYLHFLIAKKNLTPFYQPIRGL